MPRAVPKTHNKAMENLDEKLEAKREAIKKAEKELKHAKKVPNMIFYSMQRRPTSVICYFFIHLQAAENGSDFKSPEMDFKSPEMDFTSPETDFTFFIFEVHFRWVKSIFNSYLQMDLTFSKHSIFC